MLSNKLPKDLSFNSLEQKKVMSLLYRLRVPVTRSAAQARVFAAAYHEKVSLMRAMSPYV